MSINKNHLNLIVCLTLIATLSYFVFKNYVDNVEIMYELEVIRERLDKIKEKDEDGEEYNEEDNDIYNDFEGIIDVTDELGDMFHHYSYDLSDNRANIEELNSETEEQKTEKEEEVKNEEQKTENPQEQIENIKGVEEKIPKVRKRNNKKNA